MGIPHRTWKPRGFQTLFLANSDHRANQIQQLLNDMRPTNFIWVTDQERMFAQGLGAAIWHSGDAASKERSSILGHRLEFESPIIIRE